MEQPPAESDSIRFVIELFRIDLIEIMQFIFLQDFRVQGGNAIDAEAIVDIYMSHVDGIVAVNDSDAFIGKFPSYFIIQDLNDRNQGRDNFLQVRERPFFQCFCQNGMVRIGACLLYTSRCV